MGRTRRVACLTRPSGARRCAVGAAAGMEDTEVRLHPFGVAVLTRAVSPQQRDALARQAIGAREVAFDGRGEAADALLAEHVIAYLTAHARACIWHITS